MFVFVLVLICVCYITSNTIGRHLDEGGLAPQHVTTHGTAGYHQVGQNNGPLCCYFRASGQNSDIIITLSDPISWRKAILYHTDDVLRHFFHCTDRKCHIAIFGLSDLTTLNKCHVLRIATGIIFTINLSGGPKNWTILKSVTLAHHDVEMRLYITSGLYGVRFLFSLTFYS